MKIQFQSIKVLFLLFILFSILSCQSKTKEALLSDAEKQMKDNKPSAAIILLKNALEKDQNFVEARYQLGKAYTAAGKYEQAEREFQKVVRMDPSRPDVFIELAKVDIYTNKGDDALKELGKYVASHPETSETLELKGTAHILKKELKEAEDSFLNALKLEPERISAEMGLAAVYRTKGENQDAQKLLEKVLAKDAKNTKAYYMLADMDVASKNFDKALELYKKISEINPQDSQALYKSGLIYIDKGDVGTAEKIADDLLAKFPKRSAGDELKGIIKYSRKDYRAAIESLLKATATQPTPGSLYYLGLSHYSLCEYELALTQFKKIVERDPSNNQARLLIGVILLKLKRTDTAIAEVKKVLETDQSNAMAYNILGSAYMAKGLNEDAMKELNTAIYLDPNMAEAHLKKGLFTLGMGDARTAEFELKAAVKVSPEVLNTRLVLYSYYMSKNNYAKAVDVLKEGLTGKKSDALLYNYMAAAYFKSNKPAEAEASLQKAKTTDPDYFAPYFNLANFYAAKSDYAKALNEYNAVLKSDPKNAMAMINSAALNEMQGKEAEALSLYSRAEETKDRRAFLALTDYYFRKKDTNKAIGVLDAMINVYPAEVEALEIKGKIYATAKQYKEALDIFEKVEAKNPGKGLLLIVGTYVQMGDYPQAIKRLENSLNTKPDDVSLRTELVKIYVSKADWNKAIANAEMIIKYKPGSAYGYIVLASVYEKQGSIDKAIEVLKKGVLADEKDARPSLKLGSMYQKKKEFVQAIKVNEDVLKRNPRVVDAIFSQGTIYEEMGKKKRGNK
ncbi:MAG: PEP-CTERM system TPR-repeat protein PrsT [Nitrospirae bacterium]|nr:PEP-CTERM system TPR-repeat protein PrsT [Nitrospirota bacterium]